MLFARDTGKGPAILFLHGWACHSGFFDRQIEVLGTGFRAIAVDLPGHGQSRTSGIGLTIEEAADACHELIAARKLGPVLLVGWSMGALVAWSMLERHGEDDIAGLAVVDMTPKVLNDTGWNLGVRDGLDRQRSDRFAGNLAASWSRIPAKIAASLFAQGVTPDQCLLDYAAQEIGQGDPRALAAMWRSLAAQDFREFLPRMTVPTLILRGGQSRLYGPDVAEWERGRVADASVVSLEGAGHAPHLEQPDAFNAAIRSFRRDL